MCGLVSYPMHGVDNVDGMRKLLDAGADSTITASRGALAGECVLYLAAPVMVDSQRRAPISTAPAASSPAFASCSHTRQPERPAANDRRFTAFAEVVDSGAGVDGDRRDLVAARDDGSQGILSRRRVATVIGLARRAPTAVAPATAAASAAPPPPPGRPPWPALRRRSSRARDEQCRRRVPAGRYRGQRLGHATGVALALYDRVAAFDRRFSFALGLEHGGALPALGGHLQLHRGNNFGTWEIKMLRQDRSLTSTLRTSTPLDAPGPRHRVRLPQ